MPLNCAKIQEDVGGVLAILKPSFIASFVDLIKPNPNQRRFARLLSETRVAALDTWISNKLLHQFLDRQSEDGAANSLPVSRGSTPESSL